MLSCIYREAGEELLISYGSKGNADLFRTYGFTLPPDVEPLWSTTVRIAEVQTICDRFLPSHFDEPVLLLGTAALDEAPIEEMT